MSIETNQVMIAANAKSLFEQFKTAVGQPRLYVQQYFEDLKNEIEIQCQASDVSLEEKLQQQARLIEKLKEFEGVSLAGLSENVNEENVLRVIRLASFEADLNREGNSETDYNSFERRLLEALLEIETVLFRNKSSLFVKAGEEGSLSNMAKQNSLVGLLISIEDCFIRKGMFRKEK